MEKLKYINVKIYITFYNLDMILPNLYVRIVCFYSVISHILQVFLVTNFGSKIELSSGHYTQRVKNINSVYD